MFCCPRCSKRSKLTDFASEPKEEQTENATQLGTRSLTSETQVPRSTGTCFPPEGIPSSSADDDERSLDENLRPMDGQIWLPDVDAGLSDTFQSMVSIKN